MVGRLILVSMFLVFSSCDENAVKKRAGLLPPEVSNLSSSSTIEGLFDEVLIVNGSVHNPNKRGKTARVKVDYESNDGRTYTRTTNLKLGPLKQVSFSVKFNEASSISGDGSSESYRVTAKWID